MNNSINKKLIIFCGATASGKSGLAMQYALEHGNCEIVSADSMQIYKYMDIGTAKASIDEQNHVPHHMIDILHPLEIYSVAKYKETATQIINDIFSRGKQPILCGGTGLYIDSILYDMNYGGNNNGLEKRNELELLLNTKGKYYLYENLKEVDPKTYSKLHVNDTRRVIRALEVYFATGIPMSEAIQIDKTSRYNYKKFAIKHERSVLYERINKRVDFMMNNGLLKEVESLYNGNMLGQTAINALGYKQFIPYINNENDIHTSIYELKKQTRHYAKRQLSWFRRYEDIIWLTYEKVKLSSSDLHKYIDSFL